MKFFKNTILPSILLFVFTIAVKAEDVPTYEAQYPVNSGISFFNPAVVKKSTDGVLHVAGSGVNAQTSEDIVVVIRFNDSGQEISRGTYTVSGSVTDLAIDGSGNSYVFLDEGFDSNVYKFGPNGGTPVDSLNLPDADVGGGNGLVFDRERDRLYVCYINHNSGSPLVRVKAYDSDFDLVANEERDFGALEFDSNPSGFASISLDASGNVYEGGWANSGAGFYYTAHKYSPSLASEVWSSSKPAVGAFSGTNVVYSRATPQGQLVFLSEEDNDEENVIFRVGTTGTFLNDETVLALSFINALGVDGQGNAYAVGISEANSLPAVAKLDSSEDYVWSPNIWEDGSVGGYGTIDIDSGYDVHLGGFSLDFSSAVVYRFGQEVEFEQDTSSPSAIQNLSISSSTASTVTLGWTAPGDDGTAGTAASYEIRYAVGVAITTANYNSASIWKSSRTVTVSGGTADQEAITGLTPATTFFFAIKTRDEVFNISDISNSTGVFIQGDTFPPSVITDLMVTDFSSNTVTLKWTAPGDDGTNGTAASYNIRYRLGSVITDGNFAASNSIIKVATDVAGAIATTIITGLSQGEEYFFAIKARDEVLNSTISSNSPRARSLMAVPYFNQASSPWGTATYDHMVSTNLVATWGCMMTNMAMVINYYADHHPTPAIGETIDKTDPLDLNQSLKDLTSGYLSIDGRQGLTNLGAISQITNNAIIYDGPKFSNLTSSLNQDIYDKNPTILHVKYSTSTTGPIHNHFVVATGSTTNSWTVNDPGRVNVNTLADSFTLPSGATSTYKNTFHSLRRFRPGPGDASNLAIILEPINNQE